MQIAIDSAMESRSGRRRQNIVLMPELAFQIQQYLQPEDLAIASRVSKAWQETWAPFLYCAVRFHLRLSQHSRHSSLSQGPMLAKDLGLHNLTHYEHQHCPLFLNLEKYGHWIKTLEVSNLFVAHQPLSLPSHSGAVSPGSPSSAATVAVATSITAGSTTSFVHLIQDHLIQIQTCSKLNLRQLDISKTVMSLERLDDLLSALPSLKVFKFEVMNKMEPIASSGSHSRNSSTGSVSALGRGHMMQQSSHLLKRPKRISLEGLESDVVRVIARRLHRQLERLELALAVTGAIALSAFQELFESCGSTLKSLSLTRVEICQHDHNRTGNAAYQAEIAALLASLLSSSTLTSAQHLHHTGALSSSSSSTSISTSSSFSSDLLMVNLSDASVQQQNQPSNIACTPTASINPPPPAPVLESLSFNSCFVPGREFEFFLGNTPGLRELCLQDCRNLDRSVVKSILTHTPLLETLSLSSVPNLRSESLQQLFETSEASATNRSSGLQSSGTPGMSKTAVAKKAGQTGLRLKNVRLAYLRQLDDTIMEALATHQGSSLVKLSLQWCPHVTDEGILPIFRSCKKLEDLSICLSKPTLDIFKDLTDVPEATGNKRRLWACAQTLERLEIGGQMFVDRLRTSNEHLHPQLYHHLSPNPHHIRNRSGSGSGSAMYPVAGGISSNATGSIGLSNNNSQSSSSVILDPYSVAHHQGYPMYHLWRYHQFSDPFRELQAQLETLPRLRHLGIPAKGIEHLIAKGFGLKVQIQSLALLNQQGRVWSADEIKDLLQHMPHLRKLFCEKNTVVSSSSCGLVNRDAMAQKRQMEMIKVLQDHRVELVQSPSSSSSSSSLASY